MTAFWKKVCQKQVFCLVKKVLMFFSVSVYFGNMPKFARLWWPNHLTHKDSMGVIGKIVSVAFIWDLVVLCMTTSMVTIASWKSGLMLSSLKMLILSWVIKLSLTLHKTIASTQLAELIFSKRALFCICYSFNNLGLVCFVSFIVHYV